MNRPQVATILTAVIVAAWLISAIVRLWVDWPPAAVLDSAMPLVIGYWFVAMANATKNGKAPAA